MRLTLILTVLCTFTINLVVLADDPIFSGPQVGEELAPFKAQVIFGDDAGKKVDVIGEAKKSPHLLVFVHQVTRPSIGLTRMLMSYADTKKKEGLMTSLVFLTDDPTETESWMRRARRALPEGVTPVISTDGIEGPGAYGLNRKMTMTVLVGVKGKVTANFPLIQPSIQADGPKIGHAIVKSLGGDKAPTLKDMGYNERRRMTAQQRKMDGTYRRMMSPLIQKTATAEEVDRAAKAIEELAAKNREFRDQVYNASNRIVGSDRLTTYGTAKAQEYLKKWAKELAPASKKKPEKAEQTTKKKANLDTKPDEEDKPAAN